MLKGINFMSKKQSIIFTWLIYYILILMVPVCITAITYFKTSEIIDKEINDSNKLLLKRVQQQMDTILNDAERLSFEITFNSHIENLLINIRNSNKNIPPYDIYEIVQDLRAYKIPNNSIDEYYIYFDKIDLFISSNTSNDSKSFYDIYFSDTGVTYEQWSSLLKGTYNGEFAILNKKNSVAEGNSIYYVHSIPLLSRGEKLANIFILINESKFLEGAKDIDALSKGTLLILDKNNQIMASSKPIKENPLFQYLNFRESEGLMNRDLDSKNVVVSYITSQVTDWKYISVVPKTVFWEKAEYIRKLTLAGLFICLLVGAFITYMSVRKNYNPISNLIKALEKYQGGNYDKNGNEYSFIQESIDKVYSEKKRMDTILAQQNKALKYNLISRLLKGNVGGNLPVRDLLHLYDIQFKSEFFAVMVFYIEDFLDAFPFEKDEEDEPHAMENYKMVQFIMTNVIEELVERRNTGFMVEIDDLMVCLINFDEKEAASGKEVMLELASEAQKFFEEYYNIIYMTAVSSIHKTIAGIPEAYNEALQAMEYKRLLGTEGIARYEDIQGLSKEDYYFPLEVEHQLINCIKVGDFGKSKLILDEIFDNNFGKTGLSVKIAKCLMFDLISTMIKTINEISSVEEDKFLEELNPLEKLFNCDSVNEMKNEMIGFLSIFCEHIRNKNMKKIRTKSRNSDFQLKENVIEFVHQNYQDFNLGITSIAEHFNVHPIYLSKTFLEQSGETLLDFINKTRIDQAKQFFRESDSNLDEVAKAVGYSSTRTFTRAFKKLEGITPGKYREIE